jgi:hypothetical protein
MLTCQVFKVVEEKGEALLAQNRSESSWRIGWIFNKHFIRMAAD